MNAQTPISADGACATVEVWLPVRGYEGLYEVSNLGRVRRDLNTPARGISVPGHVLQRVDAGQGYDIVSLCRDGVTTNWRVHRLVLIAFCGPEPFDGAQACHNDGQPKNCALTNLRWASPIDNQADRVRHGTDCRGEAVYGAVLTEEKVRQIRARIAQRERNRPIAEDYGVSISTIHLIRHNRIWRHVA
ncbi:NUMOD4 domain-containing protein [Sphingomonas montanisoli]|nr:NUMOD4 domain-containing protein [Sphingomonas montanisoli]